MQLQQDMPLADAVRVIASRIDIAGEDNEKARKNTAMRLVWDALCDGSVKAVARRGFISHRHVIAFVGQDLRPENLKHWCVASWSIPVDLWPHLQWGRPEDSFARLEKWPSTVGSKPSWWADNLPGWWPDLTYVCLDEIEVYSTAVNRIWPFRADRREKIALEFLRSRGWIIERKADDDNGQADHASLQDR